MPGIQFDRMDANILRELQGNARLSMADLATKVGLSTSPCWRRVKRLEECGLIAGYKADIDRRSLGWGVLVFGHVTIEDHREKAAQTLHKAVQAPPGDARC